MRINKVEYHGKNGGAAERSSDRRTFNSDRKSLSQGSLGVIIGCRSIGNQLSVGNSSHNISERHTLVLTYIQPDTLTSFYLYVFISKQVLCIPHIT
jgi:hypothetical protein